MHAERIPDEHLFIIVQAEVSFGSALQHKNLPPPEPPDQPPEPTSLKVERYNFVHATNPVDGMQPQWKQIHQVKFASRTIS